MAQAPTAPASNAQVKTDVGGQPDPVTMMLNALTMLLGGTQYSRQMPGSFGPDQRTFGPSGMQVQSPTAPLRQDFNQFQMAQVPTPNPAFHASPDEEALGQILSMANMPEIEDDSVNPQVMQNQNRPAQPAPKPKAKKKAAPPTPQKKGK